MEYRKTCESGLLVRPHQPRVACHIGGEDRVETAGGWLEINPKHEVPHRFFGARARYGK